MLRPIEILVLIGLIAAGCAESPQPQRGAASQGKPTPPPDAQIMERKSPTPVPGRGAPGTSPSTGEAVEVHRSP